MNKVTDDLRRCFSNAAPLEESRAITVGEVKLFRNVIADAIEALEKKTATESKCGCTHCSTSTRTPTSKDMLRFRKGNRVQFVKNPRATHRDYVGKIGEVAQAGGLSFGYDYDIIGIEGKGTIYADDSDLVLFTPSTTPRTFKKGDIVRHDFYPEEEWTVRSIYGNTIVCDRPRNPSYTTTSSLLTLIRPGEDLKERAEKAEKALAEEREEYERGRSTILHLRHEITRLVGTLDIAHRAQDVTHATLTKAMEERQELSVKLAAASKASAELFKARMECADRADGYIRERDALRTELAETKKVLAQIKEWCDEDCPDASDKRTALSSFLNLRASRSDAMSELAKAKQGNKPRSRTREVIEADVKAYHDELNAWTAGPHEHVQAMKAVGFRIRVGK